MPTLLLVVCGLEAHGEGVTQKESDATCSHNCKSNSGGRVWHCPDGVWKKVGTDDNRLPSPIPAGCPTKTATIPPGSPEEQQGNGLNNRNWHKIDRHRGSSWRPVVDRSLNLIGNSGLFDRYMVDHSGREMWVWTRKWPTTRVASCPDRILVQRADRDLLDCSTG